MKEATLTFGSLGPEGMAWDSMCSDGSEDSGGFGTTTMGRKVGSAGGLGCFFFNTEKLSDGN